MMDRANLRAVSEITAISNSTFLVIERDGEFPTEGNKINVVKKIYKIDIANATDISDPTNGASGKLFGGKTVEELKTIDILSSNNIIPAAKTLVANLMTDVLPVYPHDKAEGLVIINKNMIAVSNDDDFGVVGVGTYAAKNLAGAGNTVDKNKIYFIKLKQSL